MVTLRDVAERCGVSASTVSRALNDVALIRPERARKIREVAQEMGYAPNAVARTLKTSRSMMIGVLHELRMDHPYYSLLIEAIRSNAERLGYDVLLLSRSRRDNRLDYSEAALSRLMDGVIIVYANPGEDGVQRLLSGHIPVISVDPCDRECQVIASDYRQGTKALIEAAIEKGHRRIAFLHGEIGYATRERIQSYRETLAAHGLETPPEYLRPASFNDGPRCARETLALLRLPVPPTCILMPDDFSALNALRLLREQDIVAPRDFSCAGYDGIGWAQRLTPRLTTYRQDTAAIGKATVETLIASFGENAAPRPRQIVIPGAFIPGETL